MSSLTEEAEKIVTEPTFGAHPTPEPDYLPGKRGQSPINGGDADAIYPAPMWAEFVRKFQRATDLEEIAKALIADVDELDHLADAKISIFWKDAKSGKSCKYYAVASKASGLIAHLTDADFVIVFNSGPCSFLTAQQIEQIVYHELRHCEQDEETLDWIVVDHDAALFAGEVEKYGVFTPGGREVQEAFRQLALPQ